MNCCSSTSCRMTARPATARARSHPREMRDHALPDLERLLKLRVVVGRIGEMDGAQWWNTRGQLGPLGASAVRRGLPRTHYFAQARAVFAVAAQRCAEVFDPPASVTLWRLPQGIEAAFDARWEHWLDTANDWAPFFVQVAALEGSDLVFALRTLQLIDDSDITAFAGLKTSAEGRAVPIRVPFQWHGRRRDPARARVRPWRGTRSGGSPTTTGRGARSSPSRTSVTSWTCLATSSSTSIRSSTATPRPLP